MCECFQIFYKVYYLICMVHKKLMYIEYISYIGAKTMT
jgi:hypothetical protein